MSSVYLVTGAAGFIGAQVASQLLAAGHMVVGIDNVNDYYDTRLKRYRLKVLAEQAGGDPALVENLELSEPTAFEAGQFLFEPVDVEDYAGLQTLFETHKFDAVINLAARAGVRYSIENPHVYQTTNAHGTLNLLELMRAHGCKKFVLASTSSLYAGLPMPFVEDLPVNTPISPYAASKKGAEVMAYTYHQLFDIDVSIVRYFTVFGPAGRPDMSPFRFIQWILQGTPLTLYGVGSQSRDFTYVDDVASGTIAALKPVGYEIINVGGGNQPVSLKTMIEWIEADTGKRAEIDQQPFHKADMKVTWADISKAKALLDWQPQTSPREGFRKTVQWHLEQQDWLSTVVM